MSRGEDSAGARAASLHLVKLCVGVDSPAGLRARHRERCGFAAGLGIGDGHVHLTRHRPVREDALLAGGSLYWVMGGRILARQRLRAIRDLRAEGAPEAKPVGLVLAPELIDTEPLPRRPFQGWRYLRGEDAPSDLDRGQGSGDEATARAEIERELRRLGL